MNLKHKEDVKAIAKANQGFTAKLYPILVKAQGSDKNLVASPFSLSSILAMLLAGAENETMTQLKLGLAMPEDEEIMLKGFQDSLRVIKSNKDFTLDAANTIFVQERYELKKSYIRLASNYFHVTPKNLDFNESESARKIINNWVKEITHDKIQEVIPNGSLDPSTKLVLVNAIYFKGSWASKFDKDLTQEADFKVSSKETIKVSMMHKTDYFFLEDIIELNAKILCLPYKGSRMSMILFLSNKPKGFNQLESGFANFDFASFKFRRNSYPNKVKVAIPKFKMESTHNLVDPLKTLGMNHMFSAVDSDFSRMANVNDLEVSRVLQKAVIELNEEGTEAAAATFMDMVDGCIENNPEFICNRPFLFAIRDELTGLVLFKGRVIRPNA